VTTKVAIYRLLIFDADGTLRQCTVKGQPCPNRPGEWILIPGVRSRLNEVCEAASVQGDVDQRFAIASNQGGVGLGLLDHGVALRMLEDLWRAAFTKVDGSEPLVAMCPHAPRAGCTCRKPEPGMLRHLMDVTGATPEETLFVGDRSEDEDAARRAGCHFAWADEFFGRESGD
jgi:D-glycero-D-manno-heptose 1,7-bisphosphate phosphatase